MSALALALAIALAACGTHTEPASTAPSPLDEQIALEAPPGVSDLTIDDRGHLWAMPERDRVVVEIELGATAKTTPHPIDGRALCSAGSAAEGRCGSIDGRALCPAGSAAEGRCGSVDGRALCPAGSAAEGRCGSVDGRALCPAGSAAEGRCGSVDGRALCPAGSAAEGRCGSIDGVPDGLDTEALTWLGGNRFAIGTEGAQQPTASVRFAELGANGHFTITRIRELTSAELGVELTVNHGVEGICGAGDELLVGIESVGKLPDGTRWAPIARLHGDTLTVSRLHLTSDKGKISALSCTFSPDGTADVLAIERHYGVSRIIHFVAAPGAGDLMPTLVLDLEPVVRDKFHDKLNLEGIVRLADGRWILVNDNQGARVEGPTKLFVLHPR